MSSPVHLAASTLLAQQTLRPGPGCDVGGGERGEGKRAGSGEWGWGLVEEGGVGGETKAWPTRRGVGPGCQQVLRLMSRARQCAAWRCLAPRCWPRPNSLPPARLGTAPVQAASMSFGSWVGPARAQHGGSAWQRSLHTDAPQCVAVLAAVSPLRLLATALAHGLVVALCEVSRLTITARAVLAHGTGSPRAPDNNERHEVDPAAQMGSTGQRRGATQPNTGRVGRGTFGYVRGWWVGDWGRWRGDRRGEQERRGGKRDRTTRAMASIRGLTWLRLAPASAPCASLTCTPNTNTRGRCVQSHGPAQPACCRHSIELLKSP